MWFRVNDGLFSDPKWSKTSNISRALWVTAGSWCSAYLTDGNVPRNALRSLGGTAKAAQGLVDVGLWEETETGWLFHDWKEYNPLRETVLQQRAETAARVQKHRQSRQADRERRNGVSNPAPPARAVPDPTPLSTSTAGKSSSSNLSDAKNDKTDDKIDETTGPARWRIMTPPGAVPAGVDADAEWDRFIERNAGTELRDPRAAWLGWLRKAAPAEAPNHTLPAPRPTPTPSRPECPVHPGQPTGSVQCPECARENTPPPGDLRALRDRTAG